MIEVYLHQFEEFLVLRNSMRTNFNYKLMHVTRILYIYRLKYLGLVLNVHRHILSSLVPISSSNASASHNVSPIAKCPLNCSSLPR